MSSFGILFTPGDNERARDDDGPNDAGSRADDAAGLPGSSRSPSGVLPRHDRDWVRPTRDSFTFPCDAHPLFSVGLDCILMGIILGQLTYWQTNVARHDHWLLWCLVVS